MAYKTASRAYCMAKTQQSVLREQYSWELRRTVDSEGNETDDSLGIIQQYQSTEEVFGQVCLKTSQGFYVTNVKDFVFDGQNAVVYDDGAYDMGTVYWKMIPVGQQATREFAEKNNCTLTSPSNTYASNRIIREVDVQEGEKISVYYLSSLFTVKGEDNRAETASSISQEVVPNWQDSTQGHFIASRKGVVSYQRKWCDRMIKSIHGGRLNITINKNLPVYIYRLAVVTLDGSYISSWDLNDSQSGNFSFTANADCAVIMDWYYPYSIKSDYTTHANSQGPTPYDWVVAYGANDVPTYSKTVCNIGDVWEDTDEFPVQDALNTYANFLKGTGHSGEDYPKGELPPALLSRNTKCRLSLYMSRDGKSTRPVVESVRIYDPGSWELLEVLNESNCTESYDNEYIWEYTMTRPIFVQSSVSSSAGVPRTVDVTIDYTPTISITDIQGNVGDITQVDTDTIKLKVNSYGVLKIQYTSQFVSKVSISGSNRSNQYMPGTVLWSEQFIHSAHGGERDSYYVSITADAPACIFSGQDSVDIPYNTTFSGGDNPAVASVQSYGDINKGYVYTKVDNQNNINYTNIPYQFSQNVSVRELSFYSDAGSSSSFNIPNYTFSGCDALKTFDLNLNNKPPVYFGSYAFYQCPSLKNVDMPNNTKSFGQGCFMQSGIESFTCPPLITAIADKLAQACRNLSTVKLTDATGLLSIGERAFSSLVVTNSGIDNTVSSLKTVTVPQSVRTIKDYAFSGNYLLDGIVTSPMSVVISGSNRFIFNVDASFKNKMSTIEKGVFSYCTGLRHVVLPSSIHTIDTEAFDTCNSISYFNSPGLKVVMNDAFKNTWLEGMESKDLELVYQTTNGYYGGSLYRKPYTTGVFFDTTSADLGGLESKHTMCTYISPKLDDSVFILYKCNTAQKGGTGVGRYGYRINKDTISISPYAFSGNYDFGNIGCYADVQMSESDVPADSKLEYIGYAAFYDNDRIMAFRFPKNGITSYLGSYAFCCCNNLSEVYNFKQQPITRIEDYTFWGCGTDKYGIGGSTDAGYNNCDFYIPDTVTSIGKYAFAKCPQLMCIANLSTCNITSIEEGAFEGCFQNATWKASVGKAVTLFTVYTAASLACAIYGGLEALLRPVWQYSAQLGRWITTYVLEYSIGWGAVVGAGVAGAAGAGSGFAASDFKTWHERRTQTAEVCLPKVRLLGSNVFKDCTHLGAIILNKNLTEIPKQAFAGCTRLHDVNFVEDSFNIKSTSQSGFVHPNIKTIGEEAFLNCKNLTENCIEHLLFNIETIKKNAFKGCEVGRSIVIPKTVNVLEEGSLGFKGDCVCIFLSKTPPSSVSSNVFSGTGTKTIGVRQGCKSAYQAKFPDSSIYELPDDDELFVEYQKYGYEL